MRTKKTEERFVFADGGYQDFPNETTRPCAIVSKIVDTTMKKVVDGELVDKTPADLEAFRVQAYAAKVLDLTKQLAAHINKTAQEYPLPAGQRFDSIHTAVSYADETADPEVQLVGKAFRKWRSACNLWARNNMETMTIDTTWDIIEAQLPLLEV